MGWLGSELTGFLCSMGIGGTLQLSYHRGIPQKTSRQRQDQLVDKKQCLCP
ncbi:hypothetical protein CYA_2596 [Synechococcus sp. JA-3-3Ab]|nr:hypothetical protein CYA_2596 [Synechococcus sp. JA-3-3Ab]